MGRKVAITYMCNLWNQNGSHPHCPPSSVYRKQDILARAMLRDASVSSADAILYGMYPPLPAGARTQLVSGGLQVVPVYTVSRAMDYALGAYNNCPALDARM